VLGIALAALHARAIELAYEPVALGWSSDEVESVASDTYAGITAATTSMSASAAVSGTSWRASRASRCSCCCCWPPPRSTW